MLRSKSFGRYASLLLLLSATGAACGGSGNNYAMLDGGDDGGPSKVVDGGTNPGDGGVTSDGGGTDGGTKADAAPPKDGGVDATATDAGDAGGITLSIDNPTVIEGSSGATSLTFAVTLSAASSAPVTVAFATADGTATAFAGAVGGADFGPRSGTLTFNPGDTSKAVTVTVNGDATHEANETLFLTLSNPTNAKLAGTASGAGTIVDDDAVPAIATSDALLIEGNAGTTNATFTVSLGAASGEPVSVHYKTTDGTATSASGDYSASGDTLLVFAVGETTKLVAIPVKGDLAIEANETFTLDLSLPIGATLQVANATGTATIQNDDGTSQPSLSVNDVTVTEGNAGTQNMTFSVSLSTVSAQTITVDFKTTDGTAASGGDYQATSGTLTFAPSEISKMVSVVLVGDLANEANETFTLDLSNGQNAIIADAQGVGTIANDDANPTITVSDATVAEGQSGTTNLNFTVSLSAASGKSVTVDYATADGTASTGGSLATGGQDYTAGNGTVVFAPGTTSMPVSVQVTGDVLNEANETLSVAISNSTNATLGGKSTGTGTISNDDVLPTLVIDSVAANEGNAGTVNLVFTVSLVDVALNPAPSGRSVSVNYATQAGTAAAPTDFAATTGTVSFAAGETQKTVTVVANGDTLAEGNETFSVLLSAPVNATIATATGTGTINNDDGSLPLLNIDDALVAEGNAGTTTLSFNVTLSAASASSVTVDYATVNGTATTAGALDSGGQDYLAATGTVTFAPGELTKPITITVNGDVADEALPETFNVVLSNVSATALIQDGTGVGSIDDDDASPSVSMAAATITEGNAGTKNLVFNVSLSAKSGRTVTVGYSTSDVTASAAGASAAGGQDYTAMTGTVSFAPGETAKTINVPIVGDLTLESDETFTVTLGGPVNASIATATATGTISNDDTTPTLSIGNVTLAEGTPAPNTTPFVFTVTLSHTSATTITVAFSTTDGTATTVGTPANRDYVDTSGTVTFLPGEISKTITVAVSKDATAEANETFFVNLASPSGATILDGQALGTITNDD